MHCSTHLLCFLILNIFIGITIQNSALKSKYAVRTNSLPTTSCLQVNNVNSKLHCFSTCLMKMHYFYTFSHSNPNQLCVCCEDLTGSTLSGTYWNSYIPAPCPGGYTSYLYSYFMICLKYVAMDTKYPDAVNYCKADGGDLIRLDSLQKYNMFKAHLAPYAALNEVQVWVQGEEHGTEWKFHDGTPFPNHCPISESNSVNEIHLRSKSPGFGCIDAPPTDTYQYMCEIYRRFSNRN